MYVWGGAEVAQVVFIINCIFYCLSQTCTQWQARVSAGLLSRILGLFLSESFFPPVLFFSVPLLVHNLIIFLRESETQQRFLCVDGKASWLGIWAGTVLRVKQRKWEDSYSKGWIWTSFSFCLLVSSPPPLPVLAQLPTGKMTVLFDNNA